MGRLPNSIGYVEYAYAKQNKMAYAQLKNKAGNFVSADDSAFQAAAAGADWAKTLPGADRAAQPKGLWPITGATFILMHKAQDKPANAASALKFFDWAYAGSDRDGRRAPVRAAARLGEGLVRKLVGPDRRRVRHRNQWCRTPEPAAETTHDGPLPVEAAPDSYPTAWAPSHGARRRHAVPRSPVGRRAVFAALAHGAAWLTLALLAGIIGSLIVGAAPAIRSTRLASCGAARWDPVRSASAAW